MFNNCRRNNAENSIWTLHYSWGWINFLRAQKERMQFKVLCCQQTKPGDKKEKRARPLEPPDLLFSLPVSLSWWELFQTETGRPHLQSSAEQSEWIDLVRANVTNNRRCFILLGNCGNVWAENRFIVPPLLDNPLPSAHVREATKTHSWQPWHEGKELYKLLNSLSIWHRGQKKDWERTPLHKQKGTVQDDWTPMKQAELLVEETLVENQFNWVVVQHVGVFN